MQAQPYYDLYVPDSDEEFEPAPSTASGMTDVERPSASTLSTASDAATQAQQQDAQAAAEVDSVAGVQAAGTAAAQETSNKSEETAVADLGEGSSRGAIAVAATAAAQQQKAVGKRRRDAGMVPASLPVAAA